MIKRSSFINFFREMVFGANH